MSETLVLLLGKSPDDPIQWGLVAGSDVKIADIAPSAADLGSVADRVSAEAFIVAILPGEQAALRAMASPPKAAAKFRAAATYLLEDELAESCDGLHVAVTRRNENSGTALAVKKKIMSGWIDILDEFGLSPDIVTADFALLPHGDGRAVVVFETHRVWGAVGYDGFAAERSLSDVFLERLIADGPIEELIGFGNAKVERRDFAGRQVIWQQDSDVASLFRLFANTARSAGIPNLRQGAYRKRRDWHGDFGEWRKTAMLAAACAALAFVLAIADGARQLRIADHYERETAELHREAFPANANADPRRHARSILSSGSGGMRFLSLSTRFAESVEENGQIQVDRIRFNSARGEFAISLRFTDINELEQLKQLLADRGIAASETGGVRRSGGFYVGELRVSES